MIPVIGVPVVNGVHWLDRLIKSVDYPTKEFCIIDNSGNAKTAKEIDDIVNQSNPFIENIRVCHLPDNLGCAGGWNLIIKSYMKEPYWILSTHDIAFTPGVLERFVKSAKDSEVGMVHIKEGNFRGSFECFLIKDWVIQRFGLFDENFYPAYVEDCDYLMRVDGKIKREYLEASFWHGDTMDYALSGGQSLRQSDEDRSNKIKAAHHINWIEYMNVKWGGDWRNWNRYSNPFNNAEFNPGYFLYDLEFNRRKYTDFK